MSFALLERFRKNPTLVGSTTPIVSFDHEQAGANATSVLKNKAGDSETYSVKGQSRIAAIDFAEQNNVLLIKAAVKGVEAKITNEDWMPIYYLPWIPNAIARTTLRPRSTTTRAGIAKAGINQMATNAKFRVDQNSATSAILDPNDPDVFVTSAVNGCSISVRGSREEPTVYHGNAKSLANTDGKKSPVELALDGKETDAAGLIALKRQDMERMLRSFETNDPKLNRLAGAHTTSQSKMLTQSNYQMLVASGMQAPSLKNEANRITKDIATQQGAKAKNIRLASSSGTVFGIRKAGKWTFYYQKLVKYEHWHDVAPWYAKANWQRDPAHPAGIHLVEFGEFWPTGPGVLLT
jgi:hypothetical protein